MLSTSKFGNSSFISEVLSKLFSDDQEVNSVNHSKEVSEKEINTNTNQNSESIKIFENSNGAGNIEDNKERDTEIFDDSTINKNLETEKEPEMFDNSDSEEDFEIPAFLRKQKD